MPAAVQNTSCRNVDGGVRRGCPWGEQRDGVESKRLDKDMRAERDLFWGARPLVMEGCWGRGGGGRAVGKRGRADQTSFAATHPLKS